MTATPDDVATPNRTLVLVLGTAVMVVLTAGAAAAWGFVGALVGGVVALAWGIAVVGPLLRATDA